LSLILIFGIFINNIKKINNLTQNLKFAYDNKKLKDLESAINSLTWKTINEPKKEPQLLESDKDFKDHYG